MSKYMFQEEDLVRLRVAKPPVYLSVGAIGWVVSTYNQSLNAVEAVFDREKKGEVQLLLEFSEIEPVD